jgi:hypothetical protein
MRKLNLSVRPLCSLCLCVFVVSLLNVYYHRNTEDTEEAQSEVAKMSRFFFAKLRVFPLRALRFVSRFHRKARKEFAKDRKVQLTARSAAGIRC